jgi:hypothetical protein
VDEPTVTEAHPVADPTPARAIDTAALAALGCSAPEDTAADAGDDERPELPPSDERGDQPAVAQAPHTRERLQEASSWFGDGS